MSLFDTLDAMSNKFYELDEEKRQEEARYKRNILPPVKILGGTESSWVDRAGLEKLCNLNNKSKEEVEQILNRRHTLEKATAKSILDNEKDLRKKYYYNILYNNGDYEAILDDILEGL